MNKYFLLDTNIYLDLIAHRSNDDPEETLQFLETILNWKHVKLIVPDIVIHEINRNIDSVVSDVGSKIKKAINQLDNTYWLNLTTENIKEFENYIIETKKKLKEYLNNLNMNKDDYISKMKDKLEELLKTSENSIIIDTEETLINNVIKRKIYKKCPFHKNEGAYADALIVEVLINIKKYIEEIDENSTVYFISRNYKEFSQSKDNKEDLHSHIISDLRENGIDNVVTYSPYFYKVLLEDFDEEYYDAKQIEDLLDKRDGMIEIQDTVEHHYLGDLWC